MSTRDHPDWWRPVGGSNAQDSTLERRSLMWNDNGVLDGVDPPAFYTCETYKGKFFPRGCRGKIERIEIYCRDAGVDYITLRYSPHPSLGPIGEVNITTAGTWEWRARAVREMWDYDSLFIWVYKCEAGTDWAYDTEQPYDGHASADAGATWGALNIRPFIRVVYTGETPGDVPISGIINNIEIPGTSSAFEEDDLTLPDDVETVIYELDGIGHCDYVVFGVAEAAVSQFTELRIYADGNLALRLTFFLMNGWGFGNSTPSASLTTYAAAGHCRMLVTKRIDFKRRYELRAYHPTAAQMVAYYVSPTLLS